MRAPCHSSMSQLPGGRVGNPSSKPASSPTELSQVSPVQRLGCLKAVFKSCSGLSLVVGFGADGAGGRRKEAVCRQPCWANEPT